MMTARLIVDPPTCGAWNMAVDEALLESAGQGMTTLRFYEWSAPTLSLGYFQPVSDRQQHAPSRHLPLVRRASGGGAIVHDRELTYSFSTPMGGRGRFDARAKQLYQLFHESIIDTLAGFGCEARLCSGPLEGKSAPGSEPFLCFQRRTAGDVLCGIHKIAGSAQRRHREGLLQHGSILLAQSDAAPELPGVSELASPVAAPSLVSALVERLAINFGTRFANGSLAAAEEARATELMRVRFQHSSWTERR